MEPFPFELRLEPEHILAHDHIQRISTHNDGKKVFNSIKRTIPSNKINSSSKICRMALLGIWFIPEYKVSCG